MFRDKHGHFLRMHFYAAEYLTFAALLKAAFTVAQPCGIFTRFLRIFLEFTQIVFFMDETNIYNFILKYYIKSIFFCQPLIFADFSFIAVLCWYFQFSTSI